MELLACDNWTMLPNGALQCDGLIEMVDLAALQAALDQAGTPFTLSLLDNEHLFVMFLQGFISMALAELIGIAIASILNFILYGR